MNNTQKPVTIGSHTIIEFPKFGIKGVSAKVDTGADSSSIWASNVHERAGKLYFSLFGPSSPHYTGEVISTKDYMLRSVKNSFGHTEFRYKVLLGLKIENRIIKVRFTLANRSENRFPVLIGRRTLTGRFLVDVSRESRKKYKVLVVRSSHSSSTKSSERFFDELKRIKKNVGFSFVGLDDLEFLIDNLETKVLIAESGKDIAEFDLVYFRVILSKQDIAAAAAQYLHNKGIPYMDKALIYYHQSVNKLHQQLTLQNNGVLTPKTIFIPGKRLQKSYKRLTEELGSSFVLKDIKGMRGRNNFLVTDKKNFAKACEKAKDRSVDLIAQQFIPHKGHYRILIFGKRIEVIMFLVHKLSVSRLEDKSQKTKPRLVEESDLPASVKRMAIKAAEASRIDIAGVDVFQSTDTGDWYCLEVNENPQLVTGSFLSDKTRAFSEYLSNQV